MPASDEWAHFGDDERKEINNTSDRCDGTVIENLLATTIRMIFQA